MFAVANVEKLEKVSLFVVNVYNDDTGYLVDQVIKPYDPSEMIEILKESGVAEVMTSTKEIAEVLLQTPGIGVQIKHPDMTIETKREVAHWKDILIELYDIQPKVPKPELPKWRRLIYNIALKITNFIGGNGKYEL